MIGNALRLLAPYALRELAGFTHTFTHFKLHITPVLLRVTNKPQRLQQPSSVWLDMEETMQAAIPTPVSLLQKSR